MATAQTATDRLVEFVATLRFDDLPDAVVGCTERLFLDWLASALAGGQSRPVDALGALADVMGPASGPSELLARRGASTSAFFAALVNAAASHVVEQDDLHGASVVHPGTVVFPAALAVAQATGASGAALITAAVAGYEAATRVGAYLGPSHYRFFHSTGTAGVFGATTAAAHLLGLGPDKMSHAFGSAGTQAAGLWEFLRTAADSKQLHTAKAAADGVASAYLAASGLRGAHHILEGEQGLGPATAPEAQVRRLDEDLGSRWAVLETALKWHAACRHTHPAADALLAGMRAHGLGPQQIKSVTAHVHQAALDVLGPVQVPTTVHQAKFSMAFVLSLIAVRGHAGLSDFTEESLHDGTLLAFAPRVEMVLDAEVDAAYPERWLGRVEVETIDGDRFTAGVSDAKGEPANPLSEAEVEAKAIALFRYGGLVSDPQAQSLIDTARRLRTFDRVPFLLGAGER